MSRPNIIFLASSIQSCIMPQCSQKSKKVQIWEAELFSFLGLNQLFFSNSAVPNGAEDEEDVFEEIVQPLVQTFLFLFHYFSIFSALWLMLFHICTGLAMSWFTLTVLSYIFLVVSNCNANWQNIHKGVSKE